MKGVSLYTVVAVSALLAACQQTSQTSREQSRPQIVQEAAVAAALPPMPEPDFEVGYTRVSVKDGTTERRNTLIAQNAETRTWRSNTGCSWTSPRPGFAPSTNWSGCPNADGTNAVTPINASNIYPLSVGKRWSYRLSGKNVVGFSWEGERRCEVEGQARVTVPKGAYDTYKVVCDDPWSVRTWYLAPEVGDAVLFTRQAVDSDWSERYELKKVTTETVEAPKVEPVPDDLKPLLGLWKGTWSGKKSRKPFPMRVFFDAKRTSYWVTDSDGTEHNFLGSYTWDGQEVVIRPIGNPTRVDTYRISESAGGPIRLSGSYVAKGKPWADVEMTKQ